MTKEELVRKLTAYDTEAEELKSQIRRLQARLKELERERRGDLEQLERGDYEVNLTGASAADIARSGME